ncbi:MAG: VWA domain-containing protein [Fuerstiella sp.]|nr:VWA domain-containing protein [Fuerstiella sp.]
MPTPSLSVCPECAPATTANAVVGDAVAECIQCGSPFLLPLTSLLDDSSTLSVVPESAVECSAGPVRYRNTTRRVLVAVFVSLIVNGGLLTVLGLLCFHVECYEGYLLSSRFNTPQQNQPSMFSVFELGGAESTQYQLPPTMEIARVMPVIIPRFPVSDGLLPDGVGVLAGDGRTGSGRTGSGSVGGSGSGGEGLFGGVRDGDSFAYVVDASGSMSGERMTRVLEELKTSVNSLEEHHQFFVVFFNKHTYAMMWPKIEKRLVSASQRNKDRVLGWAFQVQPQEVTEPQRALRMALDLKPDVLFFLTDGNIPEQSLRLVRKYRRDRTSVHTICVGEDAAIPVMQKIAEVGQGAFLMVQ